MPSSSPEDAPYLAVLGAETSNAFRQGLSKAAEAGKYPVVFFEPGGVGALSAYHPANHCAAIAYLSGAEASVPQTAVSVFVFAAEGQRVGPDVPHLTYADTYAAETALSLAVAYPPHETPVRLIGLFVRAESRAYTVWREAAAGGRVLLGKRSSSSRSPRRKKRQIQSRRRLPPTPVPTLETRFAALLSGYYPGMIDGIFAETGELAVAAAGAPRLARAQRYRGVLRVHERQRARLARRCLSPAPV